LVGRLMFLQVDHASSASRDCQRPNQP